MYVLNVIFFYLCLFYKYLKLVCVRFLPWVPGQADWNRQEGGGGRGGISIRGRQCSVVQPHASDPRQRHGFFLPGQLPVEEQRGSYGLSLCLYVVSLTCGKKVLGAKASGSWFCMFSTCSHGFPLGEPVTSNTNTSVGSRPCQWTSQRSCSIRKKNSQGDTQCFLYLNNFFFNFKVDMCCNISSFRQALDPRKNGSHLCMGNACLHTPRQY